MTLDSTDHRSLSAAVGYAELGMFPEAEDELDSIAPNLQHLPEVLGVRMELHSKQERWDWMRELASSLMRTNPDDPQWVISYAYATRRAHCLEAARDVLRAASSKFPNEPTIHYNLACYECQLGNLETSKLYLEDAFRLHPGFRESALKDPDLAAYHLHPGSGLEVSDAGSTW